ncbi:MAG: chitobiase/beta-hexosaminidase C-terminal domain-containing protein [Verrucomicrobiales bacterium]
MDGREPNEADPLLNSWIPFYFDTTTTITLKGWFNAFEGDPGFLFTESKSARYTFNFGTLRFEPQPGAYNSPQQIHISTPNSSNTTIHYTFEPREPTLSDPVVSPTVPITVNASSKVNAKAWNTDSVAGTTQYAVYTLFVDSLIFDPPSGTILFGTKISLHCPTPDASVSYLVSAPPMVPGGGGQLQAFTMSLANEWIPYTSPILVTSNLVILAKAEKPGWTTTLKKAEYTLALPDHAMSFQDKKLQLSWKSVDSVSYQLEKSSDLQTWSKYLPIYWVDGSRTLVDLDFDTQQPAFYRLKLSMNGAFQ